MDKEMNKSSIELGTMDVYTFYIEEDGNVYVKDECTNEQTLVMKIERLAPITSTTVALIRQNCGENIIIRSPKFWDDMCLKLVNWAESDRKNTNSLEESLLVNSKLNELKSKGLATAKYGIIRTEKGEPILYGPNLTVTLYNGNYFRCIKGNEVGVSLYGFWSSYPRCYENYSDTIWVFMHLLSAFSVALEDMEELLHGYKLTLMEFMSQSTGFYAKGIFTSPESMNYIYLNSYMNSGRYDTVRKTFFDRNRINKHSAKYLCYDLLNEMVKSNNYYKTDIENCLNEIGVLRGIESNLATILGDIPMNFNNDKEYKGEIGIVNLLTDYMKYVKENKNVPFNVTVETKLADFNQFLSDNDIKLYNNTLSTITTWASEGINITLLEKEPKLLEIMNICEEDPKLQGYRRNERLYKMKWEIIKQCISRNIKMTEYLDKGYSIWRLYLILSGIARGIDVSKFDNMKLKDEIAEAIYISLLKNNIDLNEYINIPNDPRGQWYHTRCEDLIVLGDALADGVDIIEEYKKGYNFRELELIAHGKKRNVNPVQYFSKGFQLNEARLLTNLALEGYPTDIEYICGETQQSLESRIKNTRPEIPEKLEKSEPPCAMNLF